MRIERPGLEAVHAVPSSRFSQAMNSAATLKGKTAKLPPAQGLVTVALAVNGYGSHFEHPGFKPIPNLH